MTTGCVCGTGSGTSGKFASVGIAASACVETFLQIAALLCYHHSMKFSSNLLHLLPPLSGLIMETTGFS